MWGNFKQLWQQSAFFRGTLVIVGVGILMLAHYSSGSGSPNSAASTPGSILPDLSNVPSVPGTTTAGIPGKAMDFIDKGLDVGGKVLNTTDDLISGKKR